MLVPMLKQKIVGSPRRQGFVNNRGHDTESEIIPALTLY